MSRSDGGGAWRSLCIEISNSEPSRAESREGTSTQSRELSGDIRLDSDWLTIGLGAIDRVQCIKIGYSSVQCIKIGYSSAQCFKIGYRSAQCIKIEYSLVQCIRIWNRVFLALFDSFRHCETISKNFF